LLRTISQGNERRSLAVDDCVLFLYYCSPRSDGLESTAAEKSRISEVDSMVPSFVSVIRSFGFLETFAFGRSSSWGARIVSSGGPE